MLYPQSGAIITNTNFLIPLSLQPDDGGLWHFRPYILSMGQIVWNIKGVGKVIIINPGVKCEVDFPYPLSNWDKIDR